MLIKERVIREVETLSETDLQQVADYLTFLKFRIRRCVIQEETEKRVGVGMYAPAPTLFEKFLR